MSFQVTLLCVGRTKHGPERELAERYLARAQGAGRAAGFAFQLCEIEESRARRSEDRRKSEATAILAAVGLNARLLVFDEKGQAIDSGAFAMLLRVGRDQARGALTFVIGGPDGIDDDVKSRADASVAFGAVTWPHQLIRIMACEQLYRAVTILQGHPYHRS